MNSITDRCLEDIINGVAFICFPKGHSEMETQLIRNAVNLSYIPEAINRLYADVANLVRSEYLPQNSPVGMDKKP